MLKTLRQLELIFRKISSFLYYIRMGKENGYPICCVVHFTLDRLRRKEVLSAAERGMIFEGTDNVYVPCLFHKKRHPYWSPWDGAFTYHPGQKRLF